jgi:hypothetical protein
MEWGLLLKGLIALGKKIPWQVYACAGLLVAFWGWGRVEYQAGKHEVQLAWDASIHRGKTIVKDLKAGQNKVTVQVETKFVDKVKVIHDKGEVIYKEIPVYVYKDIPDLPPSFRVLYDAAATNTIPEATDISHAAPAPVADVARGITQNFTQCNIIRQELISLQEWEDKQYQLYLEKCKQQGVHCTRDN